MDLGLQFGRARRRLTYLIYRTLLRSVGFKRARTLGGWSGELQFRLFWRQRHRLQRDVALILGRRSDDPYVVELLHEAYRVNNGAALEIMAMFDRRQDEHDLAACCELDGLEHLREAMGAGRGAILLATHSGNALLTTIRLAQAGWRISVVYRPAQPTGGEQPAVGASGRRSLRTAGHDRGLAGVAVRGSTSGGTDRRYARIRRCFPGRRDRTADPGVPEVLELASPSLGQVPPDARIDPFLTRPTT